MSEKATEWFGMRVTPMQKQKMKRLADQKGTTQKAAVLDAAERELAENGAEGESPSASEFIEDLGRISRILSIRVADPLSSIPRRKGRRPLDLT